MSDFEWLDALGLDRTKLPQRPERVPEESGQSKPNKNAMYQQPQPAPTPKYDSREENDIRSLPEGADRESNSAAEKDIQRFWAEGFLNCWQQLLQGGLLVHPAQQAGQDCRDCRHIVMTTEHHDGSRRKFFWRCGLGHRQLEMGFNGERIIISPTDCEEYEAPEEKK